MQITAYGISDPAVPDRARYGDDLLARIDELTIGKESSNEPDGWRPLLLACAAEIGRLRAELVGIAAWIERNETKRSNP